MPMTRTVLPLAALFLLSACTTNDLGDSRGLTKTETGALIGAASGAMLAAIVKGDKRANAAIIGAFGYYMDRQAKDLKLQLPPGIQRGETEPRADNAPQAGRVLNRRVELVIVPVVEG